MTSYPKLTEFLSTPRNIFITMHRKPDGDALGSALGLYNYLLKLGHSPTVVSPTDYPLFLHWLPGNDAVIDWEKDEVAALKALSESEIIFCLDFNGLARLEKLEDVLRKATQPKVMIDHHLEPEGFEDYRFWNPAACATAELVYEFIEKAGDAALVDKNIATCLYTGIVTDSGSFKFQSVTPRVHEITAKLLAAGVDHNKVHSLLFDNASENKVRFFGYCVKEKMKVLPKYNAAYITVDKKELQNYNIRTGDTEGLVNIPMGIDSVKLAVLIVERENLVKLSLRSKGSFPANEVAKKYFSGGGHLNAAGGKSDVNLEQTVELLMEALEEYKSLLIVS